MILRCQWVKSGMEFLDYNRCLTMCIPIARGSSGGGGGGGGGFEVTGNKLFSHTSHLTYGMSASDRSCLNRNVIFCYLAIIYIPDILHTL